MASSTPSCSICCDPLMAPSQLKEGPRISNDVNVMCAPCGHAFHSVCVTRWFAETMSIDGSCPNCRKCIPRKKCTPLFLDTYDIFPPSESSSASSFVVVDDTALKKELAEAKQQCRVLNIKFDTLHDEHKELKQINLVQIQESSCLADRLAEEKRKNDSYLMKFQESRSLKTYADEKESQCRKAVGELEKFKYIKAVLDGVRQHKEADMRSFAGKGDKSIGSLVEIKHVLQQEVATLKTTLHKKDAEHEANGTEILRLRAQIGKLTAENSDMEYRLHNVQRSQASSTAAAKTVPPASNSNLEVGDLDYSQDDDDSVFVLPSFRNGLKRSRSVRSDIRFPLKTPSKVKRTESTTTARARGGRLADELQNIAEPLSPMNVRYRSGIPGLALDGFRKAPTDQKPQWRF